MANAFLNMARSTTCPTLARRVKQAARLSTASTAVNFLAASDLERDLEFVQILNEATRDVVDFFPGLNETEDLTLVTVADQRHVLLPATLRHSDIMGVYWGDEEESCYAGKPLDEWTREQVDRLPQYYRNPDYSIAWPEGYVLDSYSGSAALFFYPMPSAERTLKIKLRLQETQWTLTDLQEAVITTALSGQTVDSTLTIQTGGANYTSTPTLLIAGGGGAGATATCTVSGTRVATVTRTAAGSGYTSAPYVAVIGGRAFSVIPDALIDILVECAAGKLQARNTGNSSEAWRVTAQERAIKMAMSPNAMRHNHMGFEGHPRPGLDNSFGALGWYESNYGD